MPKSFLSSLSSMPASATFEQKLSAIFADPRVHHRRILPTCITSRICELLREEFHVMPCLDKTNPLSLREMVCLLLLASGKSSRHCADLMHVSYDSILSYGRRIHQKLRANNKLQAFFKALKKGYLTTTLP